MIPQSISIDLLAMYSTQKSELPWAEKYRPETMNDVISNKYVIRSLKSFAKNETIPHLLFHGPSGCGKTSTIKCFARRIYGKYMRAMIMELNASNDRGIEVVRTSILGFISSGSVCDLPYVNKNSFKLIILDEFDSMTIDAQGMLRRIIEQNSAKIRFCLICNNIDKVTPAIKSRCAIYQFMPLKSDDMRQRLETIAELEHVKIKSSAFDGIIDVSNKDMRSAINTLQYIHQINGNKTVTIDDVYQATGHLPPSVTQKIFDKLLQLNKGKVKIATVIKAVHTILVESNVTMNNFLECMRRQVLCSDLSNKLEIIIKMADLELGDSLAIDSIVTTACICSAFVKA